MKILGVYFNEVTRLWTVGYTNDGCNPVVLRQTRLRSLGIDFAKQEARELKPDIIFTKTQTGKVKIIEMQNNAFDTLIEGCSKYFSSLASRRIT